MASINIEETKNQARALLNSRIKSVEELVQARQRVADLKDQLTAAERDDKRAYVKATRDGWSPEELKKLGLEPAAAAKPKPRPPPSPQTPRQGPIQPTSTPFRRTKPLAHMGTAKAIYLRAFPAHMRTTGPTCPAAHKRQDTTSRHVTTGTGECAQPGNSAVTSGHLPHGPRQTTPANLPQGLGSFQQG
jgi:hypothetical protein